MVTKIIMRANLNGNDYVCNDCGRNHSVVMGEDTYHSGESSSNVRRCSICAAKHRAVTISVLELGLSRKKHQAIKSGEYELVYQKPDITLDDFIDAQIERANEVSNPMHSAQSIKEARKLIEKGNKAIDKEYQGPNWLTASIADKLKNQFEYTLEKWPLFDLKGHINKSYLPGS